MIEGTFHHGGHGASGGMEAACLEGRSAGHAAGNAVVRPARAGSLDQLRVRSAAVAAAGKSFPASCLAPPWRKEFSRPYMGVSAGDTTLSGGG